MSEQEPKTTKDQSRGPVQQIGLNQPSSSASQPDQPAMAQQVGAGRQLVSESVNGSVEQQCPSKNSSEQNSKTSSLKPWAEHDPEEIINTVDICIDNAVQEATQKYGNIKIISVGITNQRETVVSWDNITGKPLHKAIVWHDVRTGDICQQLKDLLGPENEAYLKQSTGLPISTYFSVVKMLWLLRNVPDVQSSVRAGTCCFGTVDTWIIWKLTGANQGGRFVTDCTNASRTMLMNLTTCQWDDYILYEIFRGEVPKSCLPSIKSSAEEYGRVAYGVLRGVPISGCLGDQQAAMMGHKCVQGSVKCTYGTGAFLLVHTGGQLVASNHGLLTTVARQLGQQSPKEYAVEGAIATAGAVVTFLKQNFKFIDSPEQIETEARKVKDNGGVYFVPAFSGLLAPRWDSNARGAILGLTGHTTIGHICLAALQSICHSVRDIVESMNADIHANTNAACQSECGDSSIHQLNNTNMHQANDSTMEQVADRNVQQKGYSVSNQQDQENIVIDKVLVDGGATKNELLMQLQADILQLPVHRSTFPEVTSLGAALAAGYAAGFWTYEQATGANHAENAGNAQVFKHKISAEVAENEHKKWNIAVEKSMGLSVLQN